MPSSVGRNQQQGHDRPTFQIQTENINKLDYVPQRASQMTLMVKNPLANAGDVRDPGSIPGSGRSPGGECGNPLQYSSLENLMDRGAWWTAVHGVSKSRTWLKQLSMHPCMSPKRSPYSPAPATVRPLLSPETKCPQSINLLMTYSFPTL